MKLAKLLGLFVVAMQLSGCIATMFTLDRDTSRTSRTEDSITEIGYIREDTGRTDGAELSAGRYVLLGKKYIYLLESPKIDALFQAQSRLSRPILLEDPLVLKRWIDRDNPQKTDTVYSLDQYFCFAYSPDPALSPEQRAAERKTLADSGFSFKPRLDRPDAYRFCMRPYTAGDQARLYRQPGKRISGTRLPHPVSVRIEDMILNSRSAKAARVLMLPFAVGADIITFPAQLIILPMALAGLPKG